MAKIALVALGLIALTLGACRQDNQEAIPDLATPLIGQFRATYLITDPTSQKSTSSGSLAVVQLGRKNNNTLTVKIKVDDGAIQIDDHYEATLTTASLEEDNLLIPGLRSRYNLMAPNLNNKGSGVSSLNLYQDGKVRGGLVYINSIGQMVSLAFVP